MKRPVSVLINIWIGFVKGKFITAQDKNYQDQSKVISKFYYTINVIEDETKITMGISQEDDSVLGGYLRKNIDWGVVIIQEDEDSYWLYDYFELRKMRDYFFQATFDEGLYHIVPITTGALMRRPYKQKINLIKMDLEGPYKYSKLHPYIESTLSDIFRKTDLMWNSQLDAHELNAFGHIVNNKYLKSLIDQDFNKKNFDKASCTKKGLTEYGFKSVFMDKVRFPSNYD